MDQILRHASMEVLQTIRIGDFCFNPSHLALWDVTIPRDKVCSLLSQVRKPSDIDIARSMLFAHDWCNVHINPFQINRVGICIAKNCNLRCRYCSECSTEGNGEEIPNSQVLTFVADLMTKKVANQMVTGDTSPLKVIFTGGGEPTYEFEKFCELVIDIKELAQKNCVPLHLDITTNGAYPVDRIEFLCRHFQSIMISYDGLPDIQDSNRPSPHFASTSRIVESSIKRVIEVGTPLTLRTTISPSGICKMKEMADFLYQRFGTLFSWSIFPVTPKGRATRSYLTNENAPDFFKEFMSLREYATGKYGAVKITSPLFFNHRNDFYCGSLGFLTRVAWLRASGEIVTCLEMDNDQTVIGRLEDNTVAYNKTCCDPLIKITQQKFVECENCIAFPFCRGGCPADHRACEKSGEFGVSWACRQTISYWTYLIQTLIREKKCFGWRLDELFLADGRGSGVYRMMEEKPHDD